MGFPRPPDWLVYSLVVSALVIWSLQLRENADAPPAPPAPDEVEGALLGPITPFDPSVTVNAPDIPFQPTSGTAFSISRDGRWVTARHVVEGCRRPAILVGGGRAIAADVRLAPRADIAVLLTRGGPDAVPVMASHSLRAGQRGLHGGWQGSGWRYRIGPGRGRHGSGCIGRRWRGCRGRGQGQRSSGQRGRANTAR